MRYALVSFLIVLSGCTAEGNSYYLAPSDEVTRYASMSVCEREARSAHSDGSSRYYGYECRQLLLDRWVIDIKRYSEGMLIEE